MSLFAQHGYGKSRMIDLAFERDHIGGVILSPQYEKPDNLAKYIGSLFKRFSDIEVLVDPQFYVTNLEGDKKEGRLGEYPYYVSDITRRQLRSPNNISKYTQQVIDYQNSIHVSSIISPTIVFSNTDDAYFDYSLQFADFSIKYLRDSEIDKDLFVSLVFKQSVLENKKTVDDLLNEITLLDVKGFYIIVDHVASSYDPQFNHSILTNLLYLTYALSHLNDYDVIFGYASFVGLLLHAAGASHTACGWFTTSKQFSISRFRPSKGGQPPRERYSSIPLLNSILLNPELSSISDCIDVDRVLTGTRYDGILSPNPRRKTWNRETSALHHWQSLTQEIENILARDTFQDRIKYVLSCIDNSEDLYEELSQNGVQFETRSGPVHLSKWKMAITDLLEYLQ